MTIKIKTRRQIVDQYLDQINEGKKITSEQKQLINDLTKGCNRLNRN